MYRPEKRGLVWLLINTETGQVVGTVKLPVLFPTKGDATRYAANLVAQQQPTVAQIKQASKVTRRQAQHVDQEPVIVSQEAAAVGNEYAKKFRQEDAMAGKRGAGKPARRKVAAKSQPAKPKGTSRRGRVGRKRASGTRGG